MLNILYIGTYVSISIYVPDWGQIYSWEQKKSPRYYKKYNVLIQV